VISAAVAADELRVLDVDVTVVDEEVCGDGVTAESGTEETPITDTAVFGCELVDVGADDEKVRLAKGMEDMTTLEDEVEVLWAEEDELVSVVEEMEVDVDEELELDAGGSPGVTVHCRTTCTIGWPFGPLTGVNVTVHVSVTGPALVWIVCTVCVTVVCVRGAPDV
jgi:hypothetical protein